MQIRTLALIVISVYPCLFADNTLHPGTPTLDRPTLTAIGVRLPLTGDDNFNAVVTLLYRPTGTSNWLQGQPLFRVHPESQPGWTLQPEFAGSVLDLRPATSYDIQLHAVDPDGPVDQYFTLSATTRPVPGDPVTARVVNVSDLAGLNQALAAAQPGDIINVADGTYNIGESAATVYGSGTLQNPIVVRGESEEGTILDGLGCTDCNVVEIYGSYVHVERMTLQNANRGLRFQTAAATGNVMRYVHVKNTVQGIGDRSGQTDFYIADNILEGRLVWPDTYLSDDAANSGDDGIVVAGFGHVITHNRISGYADAMQNNQIGSRAIDFQGNDILWTYDDGVELDGGEGNMRCLRNRFTNIFDGISVQPILGGPAYVARNVVVNVANEQIKFHERAVNPPEETNGTLAYHNTFVATNRALYTDSPNVTHHVRLENNLFIGPAVPNPDAVYFGTPLDDAVLNYNGYYPNGPFTFHFVTLGYLYLANFAGVQAAGLELNGQLLFGSPFQNQLVGPLVSTGLLAPQVLTLAAGSAAIDRGVVLSNINDGYTGAAPDLGALESQCPLATYGPRPVGTDETNEVWGCAASTSTATTAALTSISLNPATIVQGQIATGSVVLSAPAPTSILVALTSSSPAAASVPGAVVIAQGATSASFKVTGESVSAGSVVTISATYLNVTLNALLTVNPAAVSAQAAFVGADTTTQGNWRSKYGADGYWIASSAELIPAYAKPVVNPSVTYIWSAPTTDPRALQRPPLAGGIASCWFTTTSLTIDLGFTDQATHTVAAYFLDWDNYGRRQTVTVQDSNGVVLDTRVVTNFYAGQYLVWNLSGKVRIVITNNNSGANAVISGIFFGGPRSSTNLQFSSRNAVPTQYDRNAFDYPWIALPPDNRRRIQWPLRDETLLIDPFNRHWRSIPRA